MLQSLWVEVDERENFTIERQRLKFAQSKQPKAGVDRYGSALYRA